LDLKWHGSYDVENDGAEFNGFIALQPDMPHSGGSCL
jgi:hypothetical protein